MLSVQSFFDKTFFVNGTEGIVLLAICIAAIVFTLVAIAMTIVVAVAVKRRKRENGSEAAVAAQEASPAEKEATPIVQEAAAAQEASPAEKEATPIVQEAAAAQADETPLDPAQAAEETLLEALAKETEEAPSEEPEEIPEEIPAKISEEIAAELPAKALAPVFAANGVLLNKSFKAKLIQSSDEIKSWYARLKNEILSYKKVKARMSWRRESFRLGRNVIARFAFRGNTFCLYLPLDPALYAESKYKVEDASEYASCADTPCMYRLKNERRVRYAIELIAASMGAKNIGRGNRTAEEYDFPYEDTEALIEKGLIKYKRTESAVAAPIPSDAEEEIPEQLHAEQPISEEAAEAPEETAKEASVEAEEVSEETAEGAPTEEPAAEKTENSEQATEISREEVEELSVREMDDVQSYREEGEDEDGIEVVGVMFRRRGRKVYWFDPDGKTWEKGEIAFYISPTAPPQEVIVVDNAKRSPSKLHLPLKPLRKASRHPSAKDKALRYDTPSAPPRPRA